MGTVGIFNNLQGFPKAQLSVQNKMRNQNEERR